MIREPLDERTVMVIDEQFAWLEIDGKPGAKHRLPENVPTKVRVEYLGAGIAAIRYDGALSVYVIAEAQTGGEDIDVQTK